MERMTCFSVNVSIKDELHLFSQALQNISLQSNWNSWQEQPNL
jgi:hypothetical protein